MWVTGIPKVDGTNEVEKIFGKIMADNFPNLVKGSTLKIQNFWKAPNKKNTKKKMYFFKLLKTKYLENSWRNKVYYIGTRIRITADFPSKQDDKRTISKVLKVNITSRQKLLNKTFYIPKKYLSKMKVGRGKRLSQSNKN